MKEASGLFFVQELPCHTNLTTVAASATKNATTVKPTVLNTRDRLMTITKKTSEESVQMRFTAAVGERPENCIFQNILFAKRAENPRRKSTTGFHYQGVERMISQIS